MDDEKIHEQIKTIIKDTIFQFDLPFPCARPARLTPIPEDQHRDFEPLSTKHNVHTPIIEIVCDDLLKAALSEKPQTVSIPKKERKKEIIDINADKEVCYEEIVRESFQDINGVVVHPFDPNVEVDKVYELFPDIETESKYELISVVEVEKMGEIVLTSNGKVPSVVVMGENEYGCTAMDISDYVYVEFQDGKAIYREITANLKLHKKTHLQGNK